MIDAKKAQVRVGLEIHQQLASGGKLFCECPVVKSEEFPLSFERRLRPAQSELGRLDPAALYEFTKDRSSFYLWSPESSCLVEADEEPPHPLNDEALDIALEVAAVLHSNPIQEVHVMRKIVIDGSNTTGFQRTAIVGIGGHFEADGQDVGVQTVTVEEDAARILGEDDRTRMFGLDRLGVPLVEIALEPVVGDPKHVEKVALFLGRTLRSTGRVARGLGTIRQDMNVSVMGGKVVEVKGVQKLNLLPKVVEYESTRQMGLIEVASRLSKKGIKEPRPTTKDVTGSMRGTGAKVIEKRLAEGGVVYCVGARGFEGLLGFEPYPGIRLGRELAEIAKAISLGGVVHSDEFEAQGIGAEEAGAIKGVMGAGKDWGLVLIAGERSKVESVALLISVRLQQAVAGVPAETRAATEDGETRYMRPRPGAQRMYPETDIPQIQVENARRARIEGSLPERWEDKVDRYTSEYSLSSDLAIKVYDSDFGDDFESLSKELRLEPSVIASILVDLPVRLAREGVPESALGQREVIEVIRAVDAGVVAKEAAPDVLRLLGEGGAKNVNEAVQKLGLGPMGTDELQSIIREVISEESSVLAERREAAFSALMGAVMKRVRGRADGRLVSDLLKQEIKKALQGSQS